MDDNTMNTTYPDYDTNVDYNTTSSDPSLPSSNITSLPSDTTFPTSSDNLFPSDITLPDNSLFDNNNTFSGNDKTDDNSDILNPNYYSGNSYIYNPLNVTYSGTGTNYKDFDNIISSYTGTNDDDRINGDNIGTYTGYEIPGINQQTFYKKDDECDYRGKWGSDEINMIKKCNKCVSNNGFYGEKQYFCDGSCVSRYNQSVCSSNGLVATNLGQCINPCYKKRPILNGFCRDDFDCDVKDECYKDKKLYNGIKGVCVKSENYKFIGIM